MRGADELRLDGSQKGAPEATAGARISAHRGVLSNTDRLRRTPSHTAAGAAMAADSGLAAAMRRPRTVCARL
jgi:hypothetical protein